MSHPILFGIRLHQNIHSLHHLILLKWWNFKQLRRIFQTALQALAVHPGFRLWGADTDFGSMVKTDPRGQTNLILWLSASHPQTHAHARTETRAHTIWRIQTPLIRRSQKDDCLTAWPCHHLIRWTIFARFGLRPCAARAGRADETRILCGWLNAGV